MLAKGASKLHSLFAISRAVNELIRSSTISAFWQ
jgi:hypothetical protein